MPFGISPDKLALSPEEYMTFLEKGRARESSERIANKQIKSQEDIANAQMMNNILQGYYKANQEKKAKKQQRAEKLEDMFLGKGFEDEKSDEQWERDKEKIKLETEKLKELKKVEAEYEMEKAKLDNSTKMQIAELIQGGKNLSFEDPTIPDAATTGVEAKKPDPSIKGITSNLDTMMQNPKFVEGLKQAREIQLKNGVKSTIQLDIDPATGKDVILINGEPYGVGAKKRDDKGNTWVYIGKNLWMDGINFAEESVANLLTPVVEKGMQIDRSINSFGNKMRSYYEKDTKKKINKRL